MPSRDATTHWTGGLQDGKGHVTLDSSNAGQFDVSFPTRAGNPEGQTSPEELIAAAHSACLAMSISNVVGKEGFTPDSIDISAEVTLGQAEGGLGITGVDLTVRAQVPGLDADRFGQLAATAKDTCPVSKALAGTKITMDASLG